MSKVLCVALVFGAIYGLFSYTALSYNDAMNTCQAKGFSYDTCFHSLNR